MYFNPCIIFASFMLGRHLKSSEKSLFVCSKIAVIRCNVVCAAVYGRI